MNKFKVAQKAPLVENLLIIEGITRAGKFLLANILNGFKNIEPAQYSVLLEEIPLLTSLGKIEPDTASELLRCEIDSRCYELLIGRNLNIRKSDKSSIYNNPNYRQILARCNQPDKDFIIKNFKTHKPYSPFILHESMANLNIYFETFTEMKCISIFRNPVDLAYSWYKRGLGKRWGTDPLLFQIPFSSRLNRNKVPWFAMEWEDTYIKSNEMTRCILSIISLIQKAKEGYNNLPNTSRNRILIVSYDDLLLNPDSEIKKISKFLKTNLLPQMKIILKHEKLPLKGRTAKLEEKLDMIKTLAGNKYLEELLDLPAKFVF